MSNWTSVVMAGAIVSSPVFEENRRGKNWLASIFPAPLMPGGIGRQWMPRARGDFLYMVYTLSVNDPVEFGADYVTTLGRKHPKRWYGVVRALTESVIEIEEVGSAVAAILRSQQLRAPAPQVTA
jgi:hypothetical protein